MFRGASKLHPTFRRREGEQIMTAFLNLLVRLFPTKFHHRERVGGTWTRGWWLKSRLELLFTLFILPLLLRLCARVGKAQEHEKTQTKKVPHPSKHCDFYWTFKHTFWHTLTLLSGSVAKRLELIPLSKNAPKRHLFNVFADIEKMSSGDSQ